jgi:elongation factor Ts
VPAEIIESELSIYRAQAADKPENVQDKIAQGKLDKWLSSVCLLEQPYVRDGDRTVDDLRTEIAAKTGENVQIKRFVRYERGN